MSSDRIVDDEMVSAQWNQKQWRSLAVCQFQLLSLFEAVESTEAESNVRASIYLRHSFACTKEI